MSGDGAKRTDGQVHGRRGARAPEKYQNMGHSYAPCRQTRRPAMPLRVMRVVV
eukprot:CAMPEP_0185177600 /NCGR_PEP_ID=MMETSP1139-20130426/29929_1 /TAXON_ID=298111 /ORGANISM="Pavlova sp., Strain CCMP459" /LENGTH=52 /DNA_ID=CAMNT_0027743397 /DNA_START=9 /DNA_END=167 /DNA_ORIENTATION=-